MDGMSEGAADPRQGRFTLAGSPRSLPADSLHDEPIADSIHESDKAQGHFNRWPGAGLRPPEVDSSEVVPNDGDPGHTGCARGRSPR